MGDASKNFNFKEFVCPCCGRVQMRDEVLDLLQCMRDKAGVPIHVNSGFRCPGHNKSVGGVMFSQHMGGNAADITIHGMGVSQIAALAEECGAEGIGIYHNKKFVHVEMNCLRPGVRWEYDAVGRKKVWYVKMIGLTPIELVDDSPDGSSGSDKTSQDNPELLDQTPTPI